ALRHDRARPGKHATDGTAPAAATGRIALHAEPAGDIRELPHERARHTGRGHEPAEPPELILKPIKRARHAEGEAADGERIGALVPGEIAGIGRRAPRPIVKGHVSQAAGERRTAARSPTRPGRDTANALLGINDDLAGAGIGSRDEAGRMREL